MNSSTQRTNVWLLTGVGLLIAFGTPELNLGRLIAAGESTTATVGREAVWWAIAAVMIAYVKLIERRSLASIGLRQPDGKTVLVAILADRRPQL